MSDKPRGKLWVSPLGRSLLVVLITVLGALAGIGGGYYHAWSLSNSVPPLRKTMGAEGEGVVELIVYGIDMAVGAGLGAIVGLVIGVLVAVFWPRRESKSP